MRVLLAILLLLAVPATTAASDASLRRTWTHYLAGSNRVDFDGEVGGEAISAQARARLHRVTRVVNDTRRALARDGADSGAGVVARKAGLLALRAAAAVSRDLRALFPQLTSVLDRFEAGDPDAALDALRGLREQLTRLGHVAKRSDRLDKRATRLFARAV